jgi:hypothetical protein
MTMQIAAPRQPAHGPYHRIVGAVGKDTVSRVWRKVKADWEAWNARSLAEEPIVRLILSSTRPLSAPGLRRRSPDRHGRGVDYSIALVERLSAFFKMLIGFEWVRPRLAPGT